MAEIEPPQPFDELKLLLTVCMGLFISGHLIEKNVYSEMKSEEYKTLARIYSVLAPLILITTLDFMTTHSMHLYDLAPPLLISAGMLAGHRRINSADH